MKTNVMNRTKKWFLSGMLAMAALSTAIGLGAINGVSAKAEGEATTTPETTQTINIRMHDGGSFRYESPLGLGFLTYVDYEYYNELLAENEVKTGTVFVRKEDATAAGITLSNDTFTIENFDTVNGTLAEEKKFTYKDVPNNGWRNASTAGTDGEYEFRGSVVNMKETNVRKDYCGRGYVAYRTKGSEGNWTYEYASYEETSHCRNIVQIAEAALADTSDTQTGKYQYEVSTGVYSPYNEAARESIYQYALDTQGAKKAQILNNLTAENYTQYSLEGRNAADGYEVNFLETTTLSGGYTGPAVEFVPGSGKGMRVEFPSGLKYLTKADSANDLYFTVWVAVKTHVADSKIQGLIKFANGVTGYSFDKNTVYAHNNSAFTTVETNVQWDPTNSKGFLTDTWYQLYIPLQKIVDRNTADSIGMFVVSNESWNSADQTNFRLLVGNIGVATKAELDALKPAPPAPEATDADILKGLTADNYTQYELENRNDGTDRQFLATTDFDTAYTGPAVSFRTGGGKDMTIRFPSGLENLTEAESADGLYFTVWVALQHTGGDALTGDLKFENTNGYLFRKDTLEYARYVDNITYNKTEHIEWNRPERNPNLQVNKWYQLYIPLKTVVDGNTANKLVMFNCVYGKAAGNIESVCRLLVGNIGVATSLPNA